MKKFLLIIFDFECFQKTLTRTTWDLRQKFFAFWLWIRSENLDDAPSLGRCNSRRKWVSDFRHQLNSCTYDVPHTNKLESFWLTEFLFQSKKINGTKLKDLPVKEGLKAI